MDVRQLELRDAGHQHVMDARLCAQPPHQLLHQRRDLIGWRRRVDDLARAAVDHVVLDGAVTPGLRRTAADALDQALVNFTDQTFRDWLAAAQVVRHQVECIAVVEQFAHVVAIRARHLLARPQARRFVQREMRALDVRGVMGFEQQGPLAHPLDPRLGQGRRFEEPARAFDGRQRRGDCVGDGEAGGEGHGQVLSRKARRWKEANGAESPRVVITRALLNTASPAVCLNLGSWISAERLS